MEITINGVKTHYTVTGQGTPFLILHGWGSNSSRWEEVAQALAAKGYQVIVPDLPGFGDSAELKYPWDTVKYVNWLDAFIKELGLRNFYLLGHSFGGALACKTAITHNQDIQKMFLVAAAYVREKTAKKKLSARLAKVIKLFSFVPGYVLFRKAVYKFIIRKSDYAHLDGVLKQTYLNVINEDVSFQIPFIRVPTVIIWGEKDDSTLLEDAYYLQKHIKNSVLEVIPGAGHDLNRKQPELVVEKILENI